MSDEMRGNNPTEPQAETAPAAEEQAPAEEQGEPTAPPTDAELVELLRQELADAQAKADEIRDRWQRAAADLQNSRRRLENQLSEERERANAALIMRLLPVLDDLDLAFQNAQSAMGAGTPEGEGAEAGGAAEGAQVAWLEGFRQIRKKLLDILTDQGVTVIDTSGVFDPARHEAVTSEPSDTVESGHIIDTLRAGYEFKGRVLRPALVRVAT